MDRIVHLRERKRVRDEVTACTNCNLHDVGRGPIPFDGPSPANIVVVGEAPGADEDKEGKPFVGSSGRLLRGYLRHNNLVDQVAFVNVVSCYPNRTPTSKEVVACGDNLASQMQLLSPRFVLIVGGIALSSYWPGERITDIRGNWWVAEEVSYLATWHPAAVARNQDLSDEFRIDIADFAEVVHGEQPWKKWWCTKCNKEATHWRAPVGATLGVPYCLTCYQATVGVPKLPKTSRTKTSNRNRSKPASML